MYNEWFSHMNKSLQNISFFSEGWNGAGKTEFVSQFVFLQPQFYLKYKRWKYNQQSIIAVCCILT